MKSISLGRLVLTRSVVSFRDESFLGRCLGSIHTNAWCCKKSFRRNEYPLEQRVEALTSLEADQLDERKFPGGLSTSAVVCGTCPNVVCGNLSVLSSPAIERGGSEADHSALEEQVAGCPDERNSSVTTMFFQVPCHARSPVEICGQEMAHHYFNLLRSNVKR